MSRRLSRFDRLVDGFPRAGASCPQLRLRTPSNGACECRCGTASSSSRNLYTPSGASRGLILVRSAYGRRFPFSTEFARPYAERGFSVLMQSTRGTFGSGGVKAPFHREIEDGADTVAWMRDQTWFPGRFAMLGASYLGYNAWAVLMDPPPELATAILTFAPHHFGRILNESGAMTLDTALKFSETFGRQEKRLVPHVDPPEPHGRAAPRESDHRPACRGRGDRTARRKIAVVPGMARPS